MSGKDHRDYYYYRAKKQNLRSRAAFKILEIQAKFSIMKEGDHVLEIGSSPGGWTQIIRSITGETVIAVDPDQMEKMEGVIFIRSRVEDPKLPEKIKTAMNEIGISSFNGILSDAMVHTSGNRDIDHSSSYLIGVAVMKLVPHFLSAGGYVVLKQFQGDLTNHFMREWGQYFRSGRV
ncbi:MAG: RlmE family RNA methyltransferase, partial [Thermoplasmataceae archaeon]